MGDLYIIAAGKGSRMGTNIPKALMPISLDEPCLTNTLQKIGSKFDTVYIVYNDLISDVWQEYFEQLPKDLRGNVKPWSIKSGLGDGHAVMMALEYGHHNQQIQDITIAWGDVVFRHPEIIDELLAKPLYSNVSGYIPAIREENPYVSLLVDESMDCMSADFSKYGESHPTGFHDQSVFRFRRLNLWESLTDLHAAFWKNGRYITPGGELSLLHCFHHMYNVKHPMRVYETDYPTSTFNNMTEMDQIRKDIALNWLESIK